MRLKDNCTKGLYNCIYLFCVHVCEEKLVKNLEFGSTNICGLFIMCCDFFELPIMRPFILCCAFLTASYSFD